MTLALWGGHPRRPRRVQRTRRPGTRAPRGIIYVGRPSRWGNPYPVERFGRDRALWLFEKYAEWRSEREPEWLAPLRGKDLSCWCRLDEPCHADILLRLAPR